MDDRDLRGALRKMREGAGASLRDLAQGVPMSHSTVGRWETVSETNPLGAPPVEIVERISDVLGLDSLQREVLMESAVRSRVLAGRRTLGGAA